MTSSEEYDYSAYLGEDVPQAEGDLSSLTALAETQRRLEEEVAHMQAELKKKQDELRAVSERDIPELMDKVGMEKFSTRNGLNITVRETIRASIGAAGPLRDANLSWLQENGHEAIIKLGVEVPFGKGLALQDQARALARELREKGLPAEFSREVHAQTLSSLVRELLEQGVAVPEDKFGVYRQRVAKVTF